MTAGCRALRAVVANAPASGDANESGGEDKASRADAPMRVISLESCNFESYQVCERFFTMVERPCVVTP